jgi:hypothetical protein
MIQKQREFQDGMSHISFDTHEWAQKGGVFAPLRPFRDDVKQHSSLVVPLVCSEENGVL